MFGKRLRSMRMKRHYTQQQMADFIDVALRTYQGYEGETRCPSFELLVKLADILDVSLDYLFGRDDFMKSHAIPFDEYQ
ncbi:MAG: helix-turn-helix domain-containing protein [Lachnospiraceae bacterium]